MSHLAAQFFLNHDLQTADLPSLTAKIAEAGYEAIFGEPRFGLLTPFMSTAWWEAIDSLVDACEAHGLEYWIWDEDLFPSGTAGGRIVGREPGLLPQGLRFVVQEVAGGERVDLPLGEGLLMMAGAWEHGDESMLAPHDLTAHCGTLRQQWGRRYQKHGAYSPMIDRLGPPHWRAAMENNEATLCWTPPAAGRYTIVACLLITCVNGHADILNPLSTERFLDFCYEPYADRYGERLGQVIRGVFTDEPSPGAGHYPWTADFPAAFKQDHGYDLIAALPHLALDINRHSPGIRHHYRQTQHRLQKAAYVDQIAAWCHRHGVTFAGHLTRTEWLSLVTTWWPNELRMYQSFDIPCADPLGAASSWRDAASYHTGLKVASSAAHLFGKQQAGTDVMAVIGEEAGLRDMKAVLDYQMVLGINFFSMHGLSVSDAGPRKDEVPPNLFHQHSEWPYMRALIDRARETCEALTGGEHVCRLAVLYPSTSLSAQILPLPDWKHLPDEVRTHELVEALLSHQRDFDFIDEETLREGDFPEPYEIILLPWQRYLEAETAATLADFAGRVIAIGCRPQLIARQGSSCVRDWETDLECWPEVTDARLAELPGPCLDGSGAEDVFILQRRRDDEELHFLFNRGEQAFDGTLDGRQVWIPQQGSVLLRGAEEARHPLSGADLAADLSRDWQLQLPVNQLALSFWHLAQEADAYAFNGPTIDLQQREELPEAERAAPSVCLQCRFMTVGKVEELALVIEPNGIGGDWRMLLNDQPIEGWRDAPVFDQANRLVDLTPYLRTGGTPTLNVITIESTGETRGELEMPYLIGRFSSEFRHGHHSLPYLKPQQQELAMPTLQPWDTFGYGTFAGTIRYRHTVRIAESGSYLVDLGRVEDVARLSLDGHEIATLGWPPYIASLGSLEAGEYQLELDVANAPANRTRLAGNLAGLLGPVQLYKQHQK